jgi:hypothetical protein
MPDYSFPDANGDIDSNGSGGSRGPYLRLHAQPAGVDINAGDWSLRDAGENLRVTDAMRSGFAFDWVGSLTGWMASQGEGQPPLRRWNESRALWERRPDRAHQWRRAAHAQIGLIIDGDAIERALWEQAGESTWLSYVEMMKACRDTAMAEHPKLPLLALLDSTLVAMGAGTAVICTFKLVRYVPRPDCMPEEIAPRSNGAGNGTGVSVARDGAQPARSPGHDLDDEIPF